VNGHLINPRDVPDLRGVLRQYRGQPRVDSVSPPNNTAPIRGVPLPFWVYTSGLYVGIKGGTIYRGGLTRVGSGTTGVPDISLTDTGLQDDGYWGGGIDTFPNNTWYFGVNRSSGSTPAFGFWGTKTNPYDGPPSLTLARIVFGESSGTLLRYYHGGDIWWPTPIISGTIRDAGNGTTVLIFDSPQAFSVHSLSGKTSGGTVTAKLQIDGTDIGGISGVGLTDSAVGSGTHAGVGGSNRVAVNSTLSLVLSGASSLVDVWYRVEMV
jgi:hypothetical protein